MLESHDMTYYASLVLDWALNWSLANSRILDVTSLLLETLKTLQFYMWLYSILLLYMHIPDKL